MGCNGNSTGIPDGVGEGTVEVEQHDGGHGTTISHRMAPWAGATLSVNDGAG
jgi:hypothetical protein